MGRGGIREWTPGAILLAAVILSLAGCYGCRGSEGSAPPAGTTGPAPAGDSGLSEIRVLVYGDSLWDQGKDPAQCDLCPLFPDDIVVTNYAAAATRIWRHPYCDGLYEGVAAIPDPECISGADRALRIAIDADPTHDVCASEIGGEPTCLADNPDHDVLLLQFGTNDVRTKPHDGPWDENALRYETWLDEILAARPPSMACVLVIPPPIWSEDFAAFNARLEEVAAIVEDAAVRHDCEVADLLGLYLLIEEREGDGATLPLYSNCAAKGDTDGDCIHWANPPPIEPAEAIVEAIDRAAARAVAP